MRSPASTSRSREGEVVGYLGPNGGGEDHDHPAAARADPADRRGGRRSSGWTASAGRVEAHRRLAYVAGEASLWPSLTGAETLHLLGRVQGRVDAAYRDELVERFGLDPSKKVRAYSKGNRQKILLIAALMTRPDLLILDEPTSGLDPLMEQVFRNSVQEAHGAGQTVFLSSHILSEVEALCDRVAILREGRLVEMGTLAQMRHLSALTVEATFDGAVPDLAGVPGVKRVWSTAAMSSARCRGRSSRCWRSWPARACASCSAASPRWRSCSWPSTGPAGRRRPWPGSRLTWGMAGDRPADRAAAARPQLRRA